MREMMTCCYYFLFLCLSHHENDVRGILCSGCLRVSDRMVQVC